MGYRQSIVKYEPKVEIHNTFFIEEIDLDADNFV